MGRDLLVLSSPAMRSKAVDRIMHAPEWTRLTFQGPRRTNDQNAKLWAMLSDVAEQREHCGRFYSKEDWKCIFMHALGQETRFVPALDGKGFLPIGQSSSDLSKEEMSDLFEFMQAWGAENGIVFSEPENPAEKRAREAGQAA